MRAAQDHGVHLGRAQRRAVGAHPGDHRLVVGLAALDRVGQARAGHVDEVDSRVEAMHDVAIAPARDRRLRASSPTRRLRVSCTAARASGVSTPITGTSSVRCRSPSAVAVAELQAITISFTPERTSQPPISWA